MAALLEADKLEAFYGPSKVLHGIDFALPEGGVTAILGANGAGKTTTLRALCGMIRTGGTVRFDGKRIDGRATESIVRLGIAHVPEGRGIHPIAQQVRVGRPEVGFRWQRLQRRLVQEEDIEREPSAPPRHGYRFAHLSHPFHRGLRAV